MSKVTISDEALSKIMEDVESLSKEEVQGFLDSYKQRQESRRAYNKSRNMTDEEKEKRKEYNKRRREKEKAIVAAAMRMGLKF